MKKYVRCIVCSLIMALLVPYITIAYAEDFVMTDENGIITYDISGYAKAKFTGDTAATQTTYEGLDGLTFYDVDGGTSTTHNWWTVKNSKYGFELYPNGYIAYTPPKNGTLSVTAFSAYSNGTRRVYITDDLSNTTKNEVIGFTTTPLNGGINVTGGTTYYITAETTRITKIIFTPKNSEENPSTPQPEEPTPAPDLPKGTGFYDAFDDLSKWTAIHGEWAVNQDGETGDKILSQSATGNAPRNEMRAVITDKQWSDAIYEFDVRYDGQSYGNKADNWFGVSFRKSDENNQYWTDDGYMFYWAINGGMSIGTNAKGKKYYSNNNRPFKQRD